MCEMPRRVKDYYSFLQLYMYRCLITRLSQLPCWRTGFIIAIDIMCLPASGPPMVCPTPLKAMTKPYPLAIIAGPNISDTTKGTIDPKLDVHSPNATAYAWSAVYPPPIGNKKHAQPHIKAPSMCNNTGGGSAQCSTPKYMYRPRKLHTPIVV